MGWGPTHLHPPPRRVLPATPHGDRSTLSADKQQNSLTAPGTIMAAELALATLPLCLKLLSECFRAYQLFTEASELGKSSQKLFWKFKIQEARLRIWAKEWGLDEHDQHGPGRLGRDASDYGIVAESLGRIRELFRDHEQMQARYGLKLVTEAGLRGGANSSSLVSTRSPACPSASLGEESDELTRPSQPTTIAALADTSPKPLFFNALQRDTTLSKFSQQEMELTTERTKAIGLLGKFRWAVVDRIRFEAMISDLRDYNEGLYCLLSAVERRRLRQALAPKLIPAQNRIDVIQELGRASAGYNDLGSVAALAEQRLCLENPMTSGPATFHNRLQIEGKRITFDVQVQQVALKSTPTDASRALALYSEASGVGERAVLVEWKRYDKDLAETVKGQQLRRLRDLAALLNADNKPPSLHVPHCLGYFADDWHPRVGFVFEYGACTLPWSLQEVLRGGDIPYVGDRFKLAHDLSLSVCILHSAGWLHKGLRSENIIFSSPASPISVPPRLSQPLLLGFEYARPNMLTAFSETIDNVGPQALLYRHPQSIDAESRPRNRFETSDDVYSLGVILLEIGLWCRVEELYAAGDYDGPLDPRFRKHLLHDYTPQLGRKMGKIYMDSVSACLSGHYANTDQGAEGTGSNEQEKFYWTVVNPLSKLVA